MPDKDDILFSYDDEEEMIQQIERWKNSSATNTAYRLITFFVDFLISGLVFYYTESFILSALCFGYLYILYFLMILQDRQTRIASLLIIILKKFDN